MDKTPEIKKPTQSRTLFASFLTVFAGIIAAVHKPTGDFLAENVTAVIAALGAIFGLLRIITKKPLAWLPALAVCSCLILPSCSAYVDDRGKPRVGFDPYSAKQVIKVLDRKINYGK